MSLLLLEQRKQALQHTSGKGTMLRGCQTTEENTIRNTQISMVPSCVTMQPKDH